MVDVPGVNGKPALRFRFGKTIEAETGEDIDEGSPASVEFPDGTRVGLTVAEVKSFTKSYERASAGSRFDLESGPTDTFLDGKSFAVRTKVANSPGPVTMTFDARSWRRLHAAHQAIQEGYDDGGDYGPVGADLTELSVKTNAGEVIVSRQGEGSDLRISISAAARDDWFVTHTMRGDDPIHDAIERMEESAEELGFYHRGGKMGRLHRAFGFVDRAALTEDVPLRVIMASEGRMADGIDLRMSGARLERYRGNPVLGYGHTYVGRDNLPIGRVDPDSLTVRGQRLVGDLEFDQGDPFAREVERKMRSGYLSAVSIGFEVTDWEPGSRGVATGWELTELSVVPVPMDASALVAAGRGLTDPELLGALRDFSDDEFARLLVRLQAVQNVAAGRSPLVEPIQDLEPPPAGVPADSARGFLEAFTIMKESHA